MRNIYGYVIFCEDIRREFNNQSSYIGVFSNNIELFQIDETTMPRLSTVIHLFLPSEMAGQVPTVRVLKSDAKNVETTLAAEETGEIPEHPQGKSARLSVQINFRFEGIPLSAGDRISVSVQVGDASTVLGSIKVVKTESVDMAWDQGEII